MATKALGPFITLWGLSVDLGGVEGRKRELMCIRFCYC